MKLTFNCILIMGFVLRVLYVMMVIFNSFVILLLSYGLIFWNINYSKNLFLILIL